MGNKKKKKTEIKAKRSIRFKIMVLTTLIVLGVMLVCTTACCQAVSQGSRG